MFISCFSKVIRNVAWRRNIPLCEACVMLDFIRIRVAWGLILFACPLILLGQASEKHKSTAPSRITTCTPEGLIGLVKYDHLEAAGKVGLTFGSPGFEKFDRLLAEHDRKFDAIIGDNQKLFGELYSLKAQYEELATGRQDFTPLVELIDLMKNQLMPISELVEKEDQYLNILMAHVLEERQFRKWERYQRKVKKAKGPKYPRPMAGPILVE